MRARRFALYFVACFTALFLCFAPVVWIESVFHDNTRYFFVPAGSPVKTSCESDSQFQWLNFIDRPLTAQIECKVAEHVETPRDLSVLRVFVIGLIAFAAALLAQLLFQAGLGDAIALATSLAVFSLPGDANTALMTNIPNALTLSTALGAFMLISRVDQVSPRHWLAGDLVKIGLAWVMLFMDGLTYPVLSLVFFWGAAVRTLTNESRPARQEAAILARDVGLFASSMFGALLVAHFLIPSSWKTLPGTGIPTAYQMGLSLTQISSALRAMMPVGLQTLFSLWFFNCGWQGAVPVALLALIVFVAICWTRDLRRLRTVRLGGLFALCVFLISLAPVFLPKSPVLFERVLLPAMGVLLLTLVVLLAIVLRNRRSMIAVLVAVSLACGGLFAASFATAKTVWNVNIEMMFARIVLAQQPGWPRAIQVVRPIESGFGYDGLRGEADEFNVSTVKFQDNLMNFMTVVEAGLPNPPPLVLCDPAKLNCEAGVPAGSVILNASDYGVPFCRLPGMILIDFNVLLAAAGATDAARPQLNKMPFCSNSEFSVAAPPPSTPGHPVNRAFWPSTTPDDFWETRLDEPVSVLITFNSPRKVGTYSFQSGEFGGRMPISWTVFGSADGQNWSLLDDRKNQPGWSSFQRRVFVLAGGAASIAYLRFVFSDAGPSKILRIYGISID